MYIYIYIYVHIPTVQRKNGQHDFCQQFIIMSCNKLFLSNHAVVFFRDLYPLICQGDEHPSEPDDSMSGTQERTQLGIFMMPFLVSNLQFYFGVFFLGGE